nr:MAG TPA: helix-turn-helix domain protein [Caudoviricetes sp.]
MRIDRIKLVAELTKRDMTQTKLAELSGVSRTTINYVKGGKSCSDEVGAKIAGALGVPVDTLLKN